MRRTGHVEHQRAGRVLRQKRSVAPRPVSEAFQKGAIRCRIVKQGDQIGMARAGIGERHTRAHAALHRHGIGGGEAQGAARLAGGDKRARCRFGGMHIRVRLILQQPLALDPFAGEEGQEDCQIAPVMRLIVMRLPPLPPRLR